MRDLPPLAGYLNVAELRHVVLYTGAVALVTFLTTLAANASAVFPNATVATIAVSLVTSALVAAKKLRDGQAPAN